jgi:CheY-like chemotaxis protein/MinD-like ATPase involved in chromosome partitioning or flagellar assembly
MAEKILIVDDDLDTLRLVGLLLQRKGYQIVAANHGKAALQKVRSEMPDLILLDVMMPDMDGFEVVRQLRQDQSLASIPIIMFTAKTQVDDKVTGFEAGADDYLTKPTHPAELIARVKAILARSARKRALAKAVAPTGTLQRGKIIGVMGASGGVGTTTVALNLGMTFMKDSKESIVVADYRPGNGALGTKLGYPSQSGLNKLLMSSPQSITVNGIEESMVKHASGLKLLLSSALPSDAKYMCSGDQFAAITKHLMMMGKYVVLDLGAGLPPSTDKVLEYCDQLIVVTAPTLESVTQTKTLLDELSLKVMGLGKLNVVLNNRHSSEMQLNRNQLQDRLGTMVGVTLSPAPELAFQAARQNVPIVSLQHDSQFSQQFNKLAEAAIQQRQKVRA